MNTDDSVRLRSSLDIGAAGDSSSDGDIVAEDSGAPMMRPRGSLFVVSDMVYSVELAVDNSAISFTEHETGTIRVMYASWNYKFLLRL